MRKFSPTPRQLEAITHTHGPMLVRAGAGTGKTTVLVERIVRLLEEKLATPEEIFAVTYTNAAAAELTERVTRRVEESLGAGSAEGLRVSTFHAACYELIKRHGAGFELLDKEQLWVFLRQQIDQRKLPLKHFRKAADPAKFLNDFLEFFSRCHDELRTAADYRRFAEALRDPAAELPRVYRSSESDKLSRGEVLARCLEVADVFEAVERILDGRKLGSFGKMIVNAVGLLEDSAEVRGEEQQRTKFLLIDEFQDSNVAQIRFAQLLTGGARNIFAVGDPDQAIYRFRGASSGAFQEFLERFPKSATVVLEENRRSRTPILEVAHAVIAVNPELGATGYQRQKLISARDKETKGALPAAEVELVIHDSAADEAYDIAERIAALRKEASAPWRSMAVIYRGHSHREVVIQEFNSRDIPFEMVGLDLLQTTELRDLVALMRSLTPPEDAVHLFRLAVMPRHGVDLDELQRRMHEAERGTSLTRILDTMAAGRKLLGDLATLRKQLALHSAAAGGLVTPLAKYLGMDPKSEVVRLFREFVEKWEKLPITDDSRLPAFLAYLDYFLEAGGELRAPKDEKRDAVQLMTAHAAKGLEFEHVFVLRATGGSFPAAYHEPLFEFPEALRAAQFIEEFDSRELHQQEERRLFYVAMTRARETLAVHARAARGKERVPSRYPRELAGDKTLKPFLTARDARVFRAQLAAGGGKDAAPKWMGVGDDASLASLTLSDSAIEQYERCPLQFRLQKLWNLPAEPAAAMQFGAAMHTTLHAYFQAVMAGKPLDDAAVLAKFAQALEDAKIEDPLRRELLEQQGREQLTAFLKGRAGKPQPEVLGTELKFTIPLEGVTITGRLDRVDRIEGDAVAIIDYKTGNPKDEKAARDSTQLALYALAAKPQWGWEARRVAYHNLQDDSEAVAEPTAKMLEKAKQKVRDVAAGIREARFPAKPSRFNCGSCNFFSVCPETEEGTAQVGPCAAKKV